MSSQAENRDFAHLRLTNNPPTPLDRTSIHNIINDIDNDILQVDQAIALVEEEWKRLKANRALHVERRSGYLGLISLLRSVPPEILGEIFLHAAAKSLSSRLRVSHVCRFWRTAALASPELWSTLHKLSPGTSLLHQEYLQAIIRRARSHPLTLIHDDRFIDHDDPEQSSLLALEVIQSCSWKKLSWCSLEDTFFQPLIEALTSGSRGTLESLTLDGSPPFGSPQIPLRIRSCWSRLSRLKLCSWDTISFATLDAPLCQLTELNLSCKYSDDATFFSILRQCVNLEDFTFASQHLHFASSSAANNVIQLPKLRKLHLSCDPILFTVVAIVVVTPILQELLLNAVDDSSRLCDESRLCQYLLANANTLCRLWISGISNTEIEDVITRLELLEELTLVCNDDFIGESLLSLEVTPWPGCHEELPNFPLPRLCALTVIGCINARIQAGFVQLIVSRWWSDDGPTQTREVTRLCHATLQEVRVEHQLNTAREVERLEQEGLDLDMLPPVHALPTPGFILGF